MSHETFENHPDHWQAHLPWPQREHHKYHRGHTLVVGGSIEHAGAAKLAALAALRTGSGLVSIACEASDKPVYAATALSLMTAGLDAWQSLLNDARKNTVLIGPGAGVNLQTQALVLTALAAHKRVVLDADALTSFAENPGELFAAIASAVLLTPHAGEFEKLFPALSASSENKVQQALQAAALSNAVVIFKGFDTVIAAPDGRAAINTNAPPNLATAGTGDVLSGICAGLIAQGMEVFEAAAAAVWIHGEAAQLQPAGLIAEDLITFLPVVLQKLKGHHRHLGS